MLALFEGRDKEFVRISQTENFPETSWTFREKSSIKQNISLEIIKNISDISYLFITFLNFFAFKTQFTIAKAGVAEV